MKKIITISLLAVLCLTVFGACVKNDTSDAAAATGSVSAQATAGETTADIAVTVTESSANTEATPGSVIIAESSNTISDSEKQEILDGLMGEIDSVLGNIDSLEDLEDSDLGTDDLG